MLLLEPLDQPLMRLLVPVLPDMASNAPSDLLLGLADLSLPRLEEGIHVLIGRRHELLVHLLCQQLLRAEAPRRGLDFYKFLGHDLLQPPLQRLVPLPREPQQLPGDRRLDLFLGHRDTPHHGQDLLLSGLRLRGVNHGLGNGTGEPHGQEQGKAQHEAPGTELGIPTHLHQLLRRSGAAPA